MPNHTPTYSVSVTSDELRAMKEVLYRFSACQNEAIDSAAKKMVGLGPDTSHRVLLMISAAGVLVCTLLLATSSSDDVLPRVVFGCLTLFFCIHFFAQLLLGRDGIKTAIRRRFTDPLIRWTVNIKMDRAIKRAPYSVVYRFLETSYAASSPELKLDRTILGDDIAIAYKAESVFCLFQRKTSQGGKSIIYAPKPEHRDLVEAFLKGNHIEVREIEIPHTVAIADIEPNDCE